MLVNAKHTATNQLQLQHSANPNSQQLSIPQSVASDENPSAVSSFTDGLIANSKFANCTFNFNINKN